MRVTSFRADSQSTSASPRVNNRLPVAGEQHAHYHSFHGFTFCRETSTLLWPTSALMEPIEAQLGDFGRLQGQPPHSST
jgi:hypothetical protein